MDAVEPGGLGGTYAGNPVACAAALAVLDVIRDESLLDRANAMGQRIKERLFKISGRNDIAPIASIRGPGAMIAFDVVKDNDEFEPDADTTKRVTSSALKAGLILLSCGVFGNTVRILVPLTVSDKILDEGLVLLESALIEARQ
jgi:4-aminobutyrate aminotransferase / (S)-3-amino-2-methylpropionate transaminase / 5-aminovalerate transaminase